MEILKIFNSIRQDKEEQTRITTQKMRNRKYLQNKIRKNRTELDKKKQTMIKEEQENVFRQLIDQLKTVSTNLKENVQKNLVALR